MIEILLAQPRGTCAGVDRAIETVENAIEIYGAPVYVRHEIVHNKYVLEYLKKKGAIFVEELDEIPTGAVTIFSAHGVAEKVENEAKLRNLRTIDATCPLVKKVHIEAQHFEKDNKQIILIGHKGHPEVEGTSGRVKNEVILVQSEHDIDNIVVDNPDNLAFITQTTLSINDTRKIIDKLRARFPNITGPGLKDICHATKNRQDAVKELAKHVDLILVIGSENSSNSNRLKELGEEIGVKSYLINDESEIDLSWLQNIKKLGLTAGASAPESLVNSVISFLSKYHEVKISTLDGIIEKVKFKLPKEVVI
jgi:4-hydroxy-3-methylbut-2-en-1-yl diphosphate reductase